MSHQTPAQRAANKAYHRKEELKKGKPTKPKAPKAEKKEKEAPRVRSVKPRKNTGGYSNLSKWSLILLAFLICGGGVIQILDFIFRK